MGRARGCDVQAVVERGTDEEGEGRSLSIKIMTAIWENSDREGSQLLLLLAMADHANDEGICWPAVDTLAKKVRLRKRQTQYLINELEKSGAIQRLHMGGGRGKATNYRVHSPAPIREERVQSSTERVQSTARKGAVAIAPESLEPSKNREEEPSQKIGSFAKHA